MAPWSSAGTSPWATRSPRASATPTPPDPTACAAGPTASPRCWRGRVRRLRLRQPRHPRTQAAPDPRRAARARPRPRTRPGHHPRRRQRRAAPARRHRRPRRGVRRGGRPDRRDRRPRRDVHDLRPGRLRDLPARCAAGWRSSTSAVREIAERHGASSSTCGGCATPRSPGVMDTDRMHLNTAGHQHMALAVLDGLGVAARRSRPLPPIRTPRSSRRELLRAERCRGPATFLGPWVHRRLTGRSSGDSVSPEATHAGPDRTGLAGRVASPRRQPTAPTRGCSSVGRARPSQGRCREFESRHPLHEFQRIPRRRARLLRRSRARQHQVVLGGPQARLRPPPCATRCSR